MCADDEVAEADRELDEMVGFYEFDSIQEYRAWCDSQTDDEIYQAAWRRLEEYVTVPPTKVQTRG